VLVALLALGRLELWNACVVVGLLAVASAFRQPAYLSAIAQLVPKPYLPQANALAGLGANVGTVVAPLAGGALVALVGLPAVVGIDVASFAAGVLTLALVRFPDRMFHKRIEPFRAAIAGGWRFIARRRPLVVMIAYVAVANYVNGLLWVVPTPLVLSIAGPTELGLVTAAGGVGAVLGGLAVLVWGGTRRRATGMLLFTAAAGAGAVLMGLTPSVPVIAAGLALRWASITAFNAHWLALMQVKVGSELLGRVLSINVALATAMLPLGFLTADPLAEGFPGGLAGLVVASGVFLLVWGLLGLRYRPLRRMEDLLPDVVSGASIDADLDTVQAEADRALSRRGSPGEGRPW